MNYLYKEQFTLPVEAGVAKLCTNFTEFRKFFGDFSLTAAQNTLAHAVYGFFNNGGTRCYVVRIADATGLDDALAALAAIDEVAIVAMPGVTDEALIGKIDTHCRITTQDRVAIFDSPETVADSKGFVDLTQLDPSNPKHILPAFSDYAAYYFPWIQVLDPAQRRSCRTATAASTCRPAAMWPASMPAWTCAAACSRRRPMRSSWARWG